MKVKGEGEQWWLQTVDAASRRVNEWSTASFCSGEATRRDVASTVARYRTRPPLSTSTSAYFLHLLSIFFSLFIPFLALGEPTITIEQVRQRFPWNGYVDIDYRIAGARDDGLNYQVRLTFTANGRTFAASNFVRRAWCDLPSSNGLCRATWNSAADGAGGILTKDLTASAELVFAPTPESLAEYMIVDLTPGNKSTARYPIRYLRPGTIAPEQFNRADYWYERLAMKRVKAGEFWMGTGNVSSGTARHRVRLTQDYFLGIFPMTQKQYWYATGLVKGHSKGDRNPAEDLSWNALDTCLNAEANIFTNLNARVTSISGALVGGFRLPTEAEWERACRAGTDTLYYTGNTAYFNDLWVYWGMLSGTYSTSVGQRRPNPWGFYEFYGGIAEWCSDRYGDYPAYSETEVTENPTGAETGDTRVLRGAPSKYNCYSGYRWSKAPTTTNLASSGEGYCGFRVARPARMPDEE